MTPSYRNGFYSPRRKLGRPKYPSLWDGCVGAWAPCLGPNGLSLRDNSGFGNHGTLTNMDVGSDWIVNDGRYCLDYDGSNDYVTCGTPLPGSSSISRLAACCWVRTTASDQKLILGKYYTTTNQRSWAMLLPSVGWVTAGVPTGGEFAVIVSGNGTTATNTVHWTSGVIINDGKWHHVGFSFNSGTLLLYVDGILRTPAIHEANIGTSIYWNSTVPIAASAINTLGTPNLLLAGQSDDYMVRSGIISPNEFSILSTRRGIAYETLKRKSYFLPTSPTTSRRYSLFDSRIIQVN